jgi:hypothetical protein
MTIGWHFDNTYSKLSKTFIEDIKPTPVHDPELVILNEQLAKELNLDFSKTKEKDLSLLFSGNSLPNGSSQLLKRMRVINLAILLCWVMEELFYWVNIYLIKITVLIFNLKAQEEPHFLEEEMDALH